MATPAVILHIAPLIDPGRMFLIGAPLDDLAGRRLCPAIRPASWRKHKVIGVGDKPNLNGRAMHDMIFAARARELRSAAALDHKGDSGGRWKPRTLYPAGNVFTKSSHVFHTFV